MQAIQTASYLPTSCRSLCSVLLAFLCALLTLPGCAALPDIRYKPQYHNPFPQLNRIAILPFRNQSEEPTLSGMRVSQAYYNELQSIPGFEVLPIGVTESQLAFFEQSVLQHPIATPMDFQQFAKYMGVDAVLQGAITDYTPYYPPRMTLKVNWYAANPGFHPIPAGYGLPWGTKKEKKIPEWIRLEAERELAKEQMKTQSPDWNTPEPAPDSQTPGSQSSGEENEDLPAMPGPTNGQQASSSETSGKIASARIVLPLQNNQPSAVTRASAQEPLPLPSARKPDLGSSYDEELSIEEIEGEALAAPLHMAEGVELPANWPDPQGFIPPKPTPEKPRMIAQYEPVISHMKAYNGNDEDFTEALGEYFYFRDDARFGGWQAYLQRSEDFIRFCCHQHIVETLALRGGQLESRMILRWPISRYER